MFNLFSFIRLEEMARDSWKSLRVSVMTRKFYAHAFRRLHVSRFKLDLIFIYIICMHLCLVLLYTDFMSTTFKIQDFISCTMNVFVFALIILLN